MNAHFEDVNNESHKLFGAVLLKENFLHIYLAMDALKTELKKHKINFSPKFVCNGYHRAYKNSK